MKYGLLLLCVTCAMLFSFAGTADGQTWGATEVGQVAVAAPQVPTAVATATAAVTAAENPMKVKRGLTFRQRREMGITFKNVKRILLEKQAAGELDGRTTDGLAVEVLGELVDANPQAFGDPATIDWDAVIEFIEKLMELIMKIIAIFGAI